jgi:hypothetical protein
MVNASRRNLIRHGAALVTAGALAGSGLLRPSRARAQGTPMPDVKALVFDTFGTVVDWRNGVAREAERILKPMGYDLDWLEFASTWRREYAPSMEEVAPTAVREARYPAPGKSQRVLPSFKVGKLDESTLAE